MKIIKLEVENIKRVRAITISPTGDVVIVGGKNGAGKSSTLDAIEMALGGGKTIPQEPVRHGARKARVVVDLGDVVVERTFSAKGTALVVRNREGVEQGSPQKLLDALCNSVCFDPLSFSRMDPKKQDEILKTLLGLDFTALDGARTKLYGQRTDANREVKRLEAVLDTMPDAAGTPSEPVDVAEVSAQLTQRTQANADRKAALERIETARKRLADEDEERAEMRASIKRLQDELAKSDVQRETMLAAILRSEQAVPEELPIADLQAKIASAETVNAKVRASAERRKLEAELKKQESAAAGFGDTIASIDDEKAQKLAEAKFPIAGLGFDESGPTLNGVPLAQASGAEKLRVSVAIGAALNPRVKVMLVRDGSLLDDDSMRLLAELAEQTGSQVWVERVGTKDASAVVIEDGAVLEASSAAAE